MSINRNLPVKTITYQGMEIPIYRSNISQEEDIAKLNLNDTDFIGFTFNKRHSSEFRVIRVSDGSRYNEDLLPSMQDKTVQVPGADGMYYFGSYYTQRQFNIQFAFDNLTEQQLIDLKIWLSDKKIHELIFDEAPYKYYKAKVTSVATIKHVPFQDESTGVRIYKGEGNVQFTCYNPFGYLRKDLPNKKNPKYLDSYSEEDFPNKSEWAKSSGLLKNADDQADPLGNKRDEFVMAGNRVYALMWNPGTYKCDFKLKLKIVDGFSFKISCGFEGDLEVEPLYKINTKDAYIVIDSKANLIYGLSGGGVKTGSIYNGLIKSGTFFKIPPSGSATSVNFAISSADGITEQIFTKINPVLEYQYVYF